MDRDLGQFVEAVRRLHRIKNDSYGDAWKKRGEVIGVIANVARKVDRLAFASESSPGVDGETTVDTAVDLLVYVLKYMTFLADLDEVVESRLFGPASAPPHSDGTRGFDTLLSTLDFGSMESVREPLQVSARGVVHEFDRLLECFEGMTATRGPSARAQHAAALAAATLRVVETLRYSCPNDFSRFLSRWLNCPTL